MRFTTAAASLLALAVGSQALNIPNEAGELVRRATTTTSSAATTTSRTPDSQCTNGPLTRNCWGNGFSIATDFDQKHPNTGKVRSVSEIVIVIFLQ
jgi:hypothetical protein